MQEKENIEELLTRAIESGQSAAIKRLYGQKDALLEILLPAANDNQNNPMGRLRARFLEAVRTPAFVKCEEGRKFIALLFGLIDVESLHSSIKSVLGHSSKTTGDHYGDIYYRAWKNATDESRPKIEEVCIQDLLNLCVTCRQNSVVSTLCHAIKAFTKQKHQRPVESMLARLLQPILWRNLAMLNSKVRLNAASLLFMVYPVRDCDLLPDERNALYRRQQDAMHTLLDDPSPAVRVVAVRGVCRVLCDYWNTLSADDIKRSLKKLIDELSKDQSAVQVRTAVFDGLRVLVDCNSAVDALRKLLPRVIRFGVNDSSDKVRLAAVQVLIALKGHRLIKFWNVLDMKTELIPRLAIEPSPLVAKALVKLMFNSYCPQGCSLDSRLFRMIDLISLSPGAARVFHRYAGSMMSVQDAVKHLQMLLQFVYMRVRQERDAHEATSNSSVSSDLAVSVADLDMDPQMTGLPEDEKENANADYSAKNLPLMAGLVDCVAVLWTVVRIDLHKPAHQSERMKWHKIAGRMLPHIMRFYTDSRMSVALLYIGSMLPESEVKYLSKSVIKKLKNLEQMQAGRGMDKEQRSLLEAACAWRFEELVKMIEEWLQEGMNTVDDNDMDETTRPRKKVKFSETEAAQPRPQQGLGYLLAILSSPTTRQRLMAEYLHILPDLFTRLDCAQQWLEQNFTRALAGHDHRLPMEASDLTLCLKLRSIIAVVIASEKQDERDERIQWFEQQVRWLDENVIQRLVELGKTDAKDDAIQVCKAFLFGLQSALLAGLRSDALEAAIGEVLRHLLNKDETVDFLLDVMEVLRELADSVMHGADHERAVDVVAPTADCLLRFIVGVLGRDGDDALDKETTTAWAKSMHDILTTVCCRGSVDVRNQCSDRLLRGITFASLHNLGAANSQIAVIENPSDDGFTCPKLTDFLIRRIVSKNGHFVQCVASQLLACIESGVLLRGDAPLVRVGGAAQLVVLLLQSSKGPSCADLRRCREALDRQLGQLDQSLVDDDMYREVRALL